MINNVNRLVTLVTAPPLVTVVSHMKIVPKGVEQLMEWVRSRRPECLTSEQSSWRDLFPHQDQVSDNELIVELAGRTCYMAFGDKADPNKDNKKYIEHTQGGDIPHASLMYQAKLGFYFAGISNRMSREIIRNYVGADRIEEGNPSEMSTRFTEHNGFMIVPPHILGDEKEIDLFRSDVQCAYSGYLMYIDRQSKDYESRHKKKPMYLDKKRIYESAANRLPTAAETAFWWTSNTAALSKMVRERGNESADSEFRRFSEELRTACVQEAPNCFPQPWMTQEINWRQGA